MVMADIEQARRSGSGKSRQPQIMDRRYLAGSVEPEIYEYIEARSEAEKVSKGRIISRLLKIAIAQDASEGAATQQAS